MGGNHSIANSSLFRTCITVAFLIPKKLVFLKTKKNNSFYLFSMQLFSADATFFPTANSPKSIFHIIKMSHEVSVLLSVVVISSSGQFFWNNFLGGLGDLKNESHFLKKAIFNITLLLTLFSSENSTTNIRILRRNKDLLHDSPLYLNDLNIFGLITYFYEVFVTHNMYGC